MRRVKRRGILAPLPQPHARPLAVREFDPRGLKRRAGRLRSPLAVVALIEIEPNCVHKPFLRSVVGFFQ
jgi:hypothetical protein